MKLETTYLGLRLKNPFMPGASPLADELDAVLALEDAGASAIVMRSLFEEQVLSGRYGLLHASRIESEAELELAAHFPMADEFALAPDTYLEQVRRIKDRLSIPVIPSINGTTTERWLEYARLLQKAGADALELNFYHIATDPLEDSARVEARLLDIVAVLKETLTIPIAVKLSPFYSALPHLAARLEAMGAQGLVLFNRFYQPDIDLETLEVVPRLVLSNSSELRLPLRWVAILYGRLLADLAITTGIHTSEDVLKALMAGAKVTMMASELLHNGIRRINLILDELRVWMDEHDYESVAQMIGSMSQQHCAEPAAFERANYMKTLDSYRPIN